MATGVVTWSTTAATNSSADSNVNWAEGQAPSSVNDSARAMMASVAKFRDDTNGSITTGGTSTAFTVTSNQSFASLTAMGNAVIAFVPHTTSGAAPTLAVDGLTAKKIRFQTGIDLPTGALVAATPYVATYYASAGEFLLHNIAGNPFNIPLGCSLNYWGTNAPNSAFAIPYGQAISRTTYSTLFTLISTQYGTGDGSTTFNLPNCKGRFVAYLDHLGDGSGASRITATTATPSGETMGATGGAQTASLALGNLPSSVTINVTGTTSGNLTYTKPEPSSVAAQAATGTNVQQLWQGGNTASASTSGSLTVSASGSLGGSGTALDKMPPFIIASCLMRII